MDTREIKRRAAESYRILAEVVLGNAGLAAVNHAAEESLYWKLLLVERLGKDGG